MAMPLLCNTHAVPCWTLDAGCWRPWWWDACMHVAAHLPHIPQTVWGGTWQSLHYVIHVWSHAGCWMLDTRCCHTPPSPTHAYPGHCHHIHATTHPRNWSTDMA